MMTPKWDTIVLCAVSAFFLIFGGMNSNIVTGIYFLSIIIITAIRERP